jgi:hypothetical protein
MGGGTHHQKRKRLRRTKMSAETGNTRSKKFRELTLLYEFAQLKKFTRRHITPTDIDGRFLIHNRGRSKGFPADYFLWFDFRCETKVRISPGQLWAFDALLRRGMGRDVLLICEHPVLHRVDIPTDVTRYKVRMWDTVVRDIKETDWLTQNPGWWVDQWFLHCEEEPNKFITGFRKRAGLYP